MPICFHYMCLCSYTKMPGHILRDKSIICTAYFIVYACKLSKSVILSNISFLACLMVYMHLFVLISCLSHVSHTIALPCLQCTSASKKRGGHIILYYHNIFNVRYWNHIHGVPEVTQSDFIHVVISG